MKTYQDLPKFPHKSAGQISAQNRVIVTKYEPTRYLYWLTNRDTRKLVQEHINAAAGHTDDQHLS